MLLVLLLLFGAGCASNRASDPNRPDQAGIDGADTALSPSDAEEDDASGLSDGLAGGLTDIGGGLSDVSLDALATIAATDASGSLPFRFSVEATTPGLLSSATIADNTGQLTIAGTSYPALAYRKIPWPDFNLTLYQTVAFGGDRLFVLWFYCGLDGALQSIWFEGTDGTALSSTSVSGACIENASATPFSVGVPQLSLTTTTLVSGFSVDGTQLRIATDGTGTVELGGETQTLRVFERVDCSTQCGGSGWYELHSLLINPAGDRICTGIFYLYSDSTKVQFSYAICLPAMSDPFGTTYFQATWSGP